MGWPSINPSYFHVNYRGFTYDLPMKRWWFWPIPIWFPYENPTFFTMPGAPPAQPHRQSSPAPSQRCLEITIAMGVPWDAMVPSGYLTKSYWKWPIYSEFSHWKWWFSIAILVYQISTVCRSMPGATFCFSSADWRLLLRMDLSTAVLLGGADAIAFNRSLRI